MRPGEITPPGNHTATAPHKNKRTEAQTHRPIPKQQRPVAEFFSATPPGCKLGQSVRVMHVSSFSL